MSSWFRKYLLPGFVFQSVVIAGGYGTGREFVEFFLTYGPLGGLLAMVLVSMVIWSVVCAASYEFARVFRTYDYRTFFQQLLGPGWVLFEILFVTLLAIIGAVIGAAAGSILQETFGVPYLVGVIGIMGAIAFLVFRGSSTIERFLAAWSAVLYLVFAVLFVWSFMRFGGQIRDALVTGPMGAAWFVGGVKYAGYNVVVAPMVLFALRHIETRREAITAGLLTGPIAMIPGVLFYLAMVGQYPEIMDRSVPANYLLELLGSRWFQIVFQIMLFGTLIESGAGMIHSLNERIAGWARERGVYLPAYTRPAVAVGFLTLASLLTQIGLIELIAKGYGTLTWGFLVIFVIPVMTVGVWKVARLGRRR